MGGAKKGGRSVTVEDLAREPLTAILLGDSFSTKFDPITRERPNVLLPLVNVPIINYTLSWLQSEEVEQVFVICCDPSKQLTSYLETTSWLTQPNFIVKIIKCNTAVSVGDALRFTYEQNVIHGDFILVSGDTVSNMPLREVVKEHKDRRKKDSNALMTMVLKQSKPSPVTRETRLETNEVFMAVDPRTKQLVYYEEDTIHTDGAISFANDAPSIFVNNDKQVCDIDICSEEVLSLFADNFDYQDLRGDLVKSFLLDDEIDSSYAARIYNFRTYDTISKDIILRWTYPLVPDIPFLENSGTKLERQGVYRASDIVQSIDGSAQVGPFTVIGNGTTIGDTCKISNSVLGESCTIGSNVSIDGCYIWNNVTIEDGCRLKHAIVCDGVILKSGSMVEPGAILSFKVIIGQNFVVPAYSKVSLLEQPIMVDSDEEMEYADSTASEVGSGGSGFIWSRSPGEEWRHSMAPIPPEKLSEIIQRTSNELYINQDGSTLPPSGELEPGSSSDASSDLDDVLDKYAYFEKEVEATFLRAVHENAEEDDVKLEVISLRLSHNLNLKDCASALFYSMMKLALDAPHNSPAELLSNASSVILKWKTLLKEFLLQIDEQIEVLIKFEEICLESCKEYSTIFVQVLDQLYDNEVIKEDAILKWASEKEGADECDKVFVKRAEKFIQWLNEASEESE